jgi:hypothetical protein
MASTTKDGLKMAKKPVVSYDGLSLGTSKGTAQVGPASKTKLLPGPRADRAGGRTLKEVSAHLMLYLHPAAAKALKRYALDQNAKVHDLLIEAVENWFQAHGLKEQVRAETARQTSGANRPGDHPGNA